MTPSSAMPHAVLSRAALAAAAQAAVAAGGEIADLRHDAWGHGLFEVASAATAAGARTLLVDDEDAAEALRAQDLPAVIGAAPDIDPILLYGLPGSGLVPVMRLVGRILSTKPLYPGEGVSYGYSHRARQRTVVALLTGGYAQGIVRSLGNRATVEVAGVLRPIVGRVAMDVCVADLQGEAVPAGTEACFFGGEGVARENLAAWAEATGLTVAEIVAGVGNRVRRGWVA